MRLVIIFDVIGRSFFSFKYNIISSGVLQHVELVVLIELFQEYILPCSSSFYILKYILIDGSEEEADNKKEDT